MSASTSGTTSAPSSSSAGRLAPGFRLDRYEVLAPISRGGMASVWLARLTAKHGFEKLVAVKTILAELSSDERFRRMFLDEATLASKIQHENVVEVLDLGEAAGVLYLVMEFVDGDTLSRFRMTAVGAEGQLPVGVAVQIVMDACAGLHAAHELRDDSGEPYGVVHRDISPQNILVSAQGAAKVIDFGIAKTKHRLAGETSGGAVKGKLKYMPPEQTMGKPLDRRTDVWAMGAVLYDLLAGRAPYDGENDALILFKLLSGDPPPALPEAVPSGVAEVVMRALAHDANARFPTADALRRALEEAAQRHGVVASAEAVAAYGAAHLAGRASRRRQTIRLGLEAAAQRAAVEDELSPMSGTGSKRLQGVLSEEAGLTEHAMGVPVTQPLARPPVEKTRVLPPASVSSLPSSSASVAAAAPKPRGAMLVALALVATLVIIAAGAFGLARKRGAARGAPASESRPPVVSVAVDPPVSAAVDPPAPAPPTFSAPSDEPAAVVTAASSKPRPGRSHPAGARAPASAAATSTAPTPAAPAAPAAAAASGYTVPATRF